MSIDAEKAMIELKCEFVILVSWRRTWFNIVARFGQILIDLLLQSPLPASDQAWQGR